VKVISLRGNRTLIRRHEFMFICALSLTVMPALAGELNIDDRTSCSVAAKAFDKEDVPAMRAVINFIVATMENMDSMHTEKGEPGIVAQLDDKGMQELWAHAVAHCQLYPRSTIYNSAGFVYTGTRDLEMQLGVAK
jgi:hypothetical protein